MGLFPMGNYPAETTDAPKAAEVLTPRAEHAPKPDEPAKPDIDRIWRAVVDISQGNR